MDCVYYVVGGDRRSCYMSGANLDIDAGFNESDL